MVLNKPWVGQHDDEDPVYDVNCRDGSDEWEPEPEEDVDLLVDDVQAEHAQAVELLLARGRADAVKRAAERNLFLIVSNVLL